MRITFKSLLNFRISIIVALQKIIVKYNSYLGYKMVVLTVIFCAYNGYRYRHISCCHNE